MNKKISTIFYLGIAVLMLVITSCNISNQPPLSIDGGISWTIISARLQNNIAAAMEDMVVIATSTTSGRTFGGVVDASGNVQIRVPQDESFILGLIDETGQALGPITFQTGTRKTRSVASDALMGIKTPDSSSPLDLGTIEIPDSVTTEPIVALVGAATIDSTITASVDPATGVPLGIGELGKPDSPMSTVPTGANKADPDMDGLPNFIDADDDGDGILDDFDPDADGDGYADSSTSSTAKLPVIFRIGYILDTDTDEDSFVEIEYFMSINEDSFIKNRLHFSIVQNTDR